MSIRDADGGRAHAGGHADARDAPVRSSPDVPAVASSFVGRARELAALEGLTRRERLVTVAGPGGCGKSRVAVEFVRRGALPVHGFVELASLDAGADLPSAVLSSCGLREEPGRPASDLLRDRLARHAGLLVLDNCEHLHVAVADLVAGLLRDCPTLRVLTTSRVSIGLAGESVLPMAGLDPDGDGVALLLDRARSVQPDLPTGSHTYSVAVEICRLADGLPLAIELAAAHARTVPLARIRDGMTERLTFLAARLPAGLPRHRSLVSSLDWSADLVGEPARQALAALSVVDGRFPLEVAVAVTAGDLRALETLVDYSLVQFDAVDGRYVLLETVREYAAALLAGSSAGDTAHARLLGWAAGFGLEVRDGLERADPDVLYRVAQADPAVSSAVDRALDTGEGVVVAAGVAVDLAFSWSLRGRCSEGLARVRRLADSLDPTPPALQWAHAFLAVYSGDLHGGFALAAQAAEQAGQDRRTAARALILTGLVQMFVDPAGADPVLTDAAASARNAGDDWAQVEASQCLAYTHLLRGAFAEAVACADAVLPALRHLGHGQLRAWDAAIRADAAAVAGRLDEGVEEGRRGFALAVSVGEPVSAFGALTPLLRCLVVTGRQAEAVKVLADGLRFLDTHPGLGTRASSAMAAAIAASTGDPTKAAATAQVALQLAPEMPSMLSEAALLLATARLRAGDPDGARQAAATAQSSAAALGNSGALAAATLAWAAAGRARGQDAPAPLATAAHEALTCAHAHGMRLLVVDGLALVAALAYDAGRSSVAARLHGAGQRLRAELGVVVAPLADLLDVDDAFVAAHSAAAAEGARLGEAGAVGYAARSRGRRDRPSTGWDSLTPTEREVVALAAQGQPTLQIATGLLISTGTVRTHLRSIYAKVGVHNRAELAARAAGREL